MPSNAVGMVGKVLSTSFDSIPFRNGVYFLGSNVSVWAIPPAIKSKITESADAGILSAPQEDSSPPNGAPIPMVAIAAALVFLINSLRLSDVFILFGYICFSRGFSQK